MPHTLELYWDFSSPFAYLGSTQAEALAARTGATLVWRPMLLGALFKTLGVADAPILTWSDAKRNYYFKDLDPVGRALGGPVPLPEPLPDDDGQAVARVARAPRGATQGVSRRDVSRVLGGGPRHLR